MRDVAALAGVSLKTVSRVINGESTVAADLAQRVHRAAEQLDYRPNLAARALRLSSGRTRTVGVVLEDIANPFSAAVVRAVENVSRERDVAVFAASVDEDPERERRAARALVSRRVDGLIIMPTGDDQRYLMPDQRAGMKIVFVDRPPRLFAADTVMCDNAPASAAAVAHLVAHGHRRIAFLGDLERIATATERFAGYRLALAQAGVEYVSGLVRFGVRGAEAGQAVTAELVSGPAPPTAVFATQNLITIGAVRALRALGLRDRVALVGFDDFALADMLEPAVTVVAQDPAGIGAVACRLLFDRMDGDASAPRSEVVPARLIVRGSGEIPPAVRM
jgi:LacI family transcriptional regulator